jgi:hypothetical protein
VLHCSWTSPTIAMRMVWPIGFESWNAPIRNLCLA